MAKKDSHTQGLGLIIICFGGRGQRDILYSVEYLAAPLDSTQQVLVAIPQLCDQNYLYTLPNVPGEEVVSCKVSLEWKSLP